DSKFLEGLNDSSKSIDDRLSLLQDFHRKIVRARFEGPTVLEAVKALPSLFRHKSPRVQESARLAYIDASLKLPGGSEEHLDSLKLIRAWTSNSSLPDAVREKSKRHALDLLDRLPRGHAELNRSIKKIMQGLSQAKELKAKGRLALSALERLIPKFP